MSKKVSNNATEFHVDTRFQQMARRPGGIPRDQAIARAQEGIEDVRPDLDAFLDRELQELNDLMVEALRNPDNTRWVKDAKEHARQLRNVGSTIGFELLTHIADTLCDLFDKVSKGEEHSPESIKCYVDSLHLARRDEYRNVKPEQVPELTEGLRQVAEKLRRTK
ncbi:MAG: hypothetical protein AB7O50_04745 [Pseudolabrys sp.]